MLRSAPDGGLRGPDLHVSLLFEARLEGGHVHVKVRAAARHPSVQVNHSRGLSGELVFRPEEWLMLRAILEAGAACADDWTNADLPRAFFDGRGKVLAPAGIGYEPAGPDHDGQRVVEFTEVGFE